MSTDWKQLLLTGDALPEIYTVIGRHPLDPDREELLVAVHEAAGQLQAWHSHSDEVVRLRALRWHRELCGYESIFRDPERFLAYEQTIITDLANKYVEGAGADSRRWNTAALEQWLRLIHNVQPTRLVETAQAIIRSSQPENTAEPPPSGTPASAASPAWDAGLGGVRRMDWGDIAARVRPESTDSVDLRSPSQQASSGAFPAALQSGGFTTPPLAHQSPHNAPSTEEKTRGANRPQALPTYYRPPSQYGNVQPTTGMSPAARATWIIVALLLAIMLPTIFGLWLILYAEGDSTNVTRAEAKSETSLPAANPSVVKRSLPTSSSPNPSARSSVPKPVATPSSIKDPQGSFDERRPPNVPTNPQPTSSPSQPSLLSPSPTPVAPPMPNLHEQPLTLPHKSAVVALAWNHKADKLATGDAQGNVTIWDTTAGKIEKEFLAMHTGRVTAIAFSFDDRWLATTSEDAKVLVMGLPDYGVHAVTGVGSSASATTALTWRPGFPQQLFIGDTTGGLASCKASEGAKWQAQTRASVLTGGVRQLSSNQATNGFRLAVTFAGGGVTVGDPDASAPDLVFLTQEHPYWDEAVQPSKSTDRKQLQTILVPLTVERIHGTSFNDRDSQLAIACGDVEVWGLAPKVGAIRVRLIPGATDLNGYRCIDWSMTRRFLAAGDAKGRLNVWEMPTCKQFTQFLHSQAVTATAWSPAAPERLASACDDGTVRVWQLPTTPAPGPFTDLDAIIKMAIQFAADGDPDGMYRAACLLQTQTLSSTQHTQLEDLRAKLQQQAAERMDQLLSKYASTPSEGPVQVSESKHPGALKALGGRDRIEPVLELFNVMNWDPGGKYGAEARMRVEELISKATLTPAKMRPR